MCIRLGSVIYPRHHWQAEHELNQACNARDRSLKLEERRKLINNARNHGFEHSELQE